MNKKKPSAQTKEPKLTKRHFEQLLMKAAQPMKPPDSKETQTSESHPSGGYSVVVKLSGVKGGKDGHT